MSAVTPLDIKVIYPISGRRSRPARPMRASAGSSAATRSLTIGVVTAIVAGGLCFATWWPIDRMIYRTLMWKAVIPSNQMAVILDALSRPRPGDPAPPAAAPTKVDSSATDAATRTMKRVGEVGYAWLAMSTIGYCVTAMAAGVCVSGASRTNRRRIWVILMFGALAFFAFNIWDVWKTSGMSYDPRTLRYGMASLGGIALLIGLVIGVRARLFATIAGLTLVAAAIVSVVSVQLWGQCGALEPQHHSLGFMCLVFAAHSLYGWLLIFPLSARLPR